MNCKEIRRQLSEALDGTPMPASARRHLDSCAACAAAFARMSAMGAAFSSLPARAPSAGFDAAVLAALAPRRAASPLLKIGVLIGGAFAGAAATAAARALSGVSWPALAALAGRGAAAAAQARVLARALWIFLPEPRFGVELTIASLLACAVVATICRPSIPVVRPLGAR